MKRISILILAFLLVAANITSSLAEEKNDSDAITIYVNSDVNGDGLSKDTPTTMEKAIEMINNDVSNTSEYVISLVGDTEYESDDSSIGFEKNKTTILGNGYKIITRRIRVLNDAELHLGRTDDEASILECGAVISVFDNAKVHMYDGTSLIPLEGGNIGGSGNYGYGQAVTLSGRESGKAEFIMHGGKISKYNYAPIGAIQVENGGVFTMLGGEISELSASYGGAITIPQSGTGTIILKGGTIKNNTGTYGGAIYAYGGKIVIDGPVVFENNRSDEYGGAIYISGDSEVEIKGEAIFSGNEAKTVGGAICALDSNIKISGSSFTKNIARGYDEKGKLGEGGAIYLQDTNLVLENCDIIDNIAGVSGGGLCVTQSDDKPLPTISFKGKINILNNIVEADEGEIKNNLYLCDHPEGRNSIVLIDENINPETKIGITMEHLGVFTANYGNSHLSMDSVIFLSDDERYHIEKENGECKLAPHIAELINVKEPSCNEEGYTGDSICKICKFLIGKGEKISKIICEAVDNDTVNDYKVPATGAIDSYH